MSQDVPYPYSGVVTATTSYTYDAIGRTLSVTAASTGTGSTSGVTNYVYAGNTVTVTVTAATNVVKKYTMDAFGHLTQVNEDPSGVNYVTTYGYDVLDHLTDVWMTRSSVTQHRVFSYTGKFLMSATNPENGTVNYTYDSTTHKVATRIDNANQKAAYTYDAYARLSEVQRYYLVSGSYVEDTCQRETYTYDSDGTGYSSNVVGRLASVTYMGGNNPNLTAPTCDTTFTERYNYGVPGAPTGKRLNFQRTVTPYSDSSSTTTESINLDATFTYDNEGRMTNEQYPSWVDGYGTTNAGPNLGYTFDSMGRLSTLTEQNASLSVIGGTSYGPANELTGISTGGTGGWGGETRTYNGLKQLTSIVSSGVNMQYHYPSTANNGKIDYQIDNNLSAEQVNYTYDSLNRLIAAAVSGGWNQGFTYDGFGNLTAVSGTGSFSTSYDSSNQMQTCTDANGNSASLASGCSYYYMNNYDIENRISMTAPGSPGGKVYYSYAPGNKRVWRGSWTGSVGSYTPSIDEITFYSVSGQKLASYQLTFMQGCCVGTDMYMAPQFYIAPTDTDYYFGSKLIKNGTSNNWVYTDRLGSVAKYYPYGGDKGSSNPPSGEKFTGYFRDAETGNDYADQRYSSPGAGRFLTPDRGMGGQPSNPSTWNKYAYAGDDPVNHADPSGSEWVCVGGQYGEPSDCFDDGSDDSIGQFCSIAIAMGATEWYAEHCAAPNGYGGGQAPAAPSQAALSAQTQSILSSAASSLASEFASAVWLPPAPCQSDLSSIHGGLGPVFFTPTFATIAQSAAHVQFVDIASAGTPADVKEAQDGAYMLTPYTFGTVTNTIYYSAGFGVGGTLVGSSSNVDYVLGSVMHELLHTLGITDDQLESGLRVEGGYSDAVSKKLATDCFGYLP